MLQGCEALERWGMLSPPRKLPVSWRKSRRSGDLSAHAHTPDLGRGPLHPRALFSGVSPGSMQFLARARTLASDIRRLSK